MTKHNWQMLIDPMNDLEEDSGSSETDLTPSDNYDYFTVLINQTGYLHDLCCKEQKLVTALKGKPSHTFSLRRSFTKTLVKVLSEFESLLFLLARGSGTTYVKLMQEVSAEPDCPIQAQVQADRLIIYMQHLPSRSLTQLHHHTDLLAAKLALLEMPHWKIYNIDFFHVFNSSTIHLAKDVDNYTYKRVIDVIALMLGSSDSARYCSITADTVCDDSVLSGTYIQVTPKAQFSLLPEHMKITKKVGFLAEQKTENI